MLLKFPTRARGPGLEKKRFSYSYTGGVGRDILLLPGGSQCMDSINVTVSMQEILESRSEELKKLSMKLILERTWQS